MPLVILHRDPNSIPDNVAVQIAKAMQKIIAKELDTPEQRDGKLTENDIEVRIREHGPLDVNTLPLQIEVFANDFPERRKNLKERTRRMARQIRVLPCFPDGLKGREKSFIWVLLAPAGFEML